ncbi:MAG: VOC family protein [Jatrophihabitantaceae bacterium]
MPIPTTVYAHVRLTVTDIARSRAFYDEVFGLPVVFEVPEGADEATRAQLAFLEGGVIYSVGDNHFGLRPAAPPGDRFDENRVGLDHVSFRVGARADLENTVGVLEGLGVSHAGIKDLGPVYILEFRDPDNIALELAAAKAADAPASS